MYASPGWIPFASDSGGNCLGIDLDPGPTGTRGQVINFGRDEDEKFVLAPSMNEFLEWFADQLESGNFLIREVPKPSTRAYVVQRLVPQESVSAPEPMWRSLSTKNPPTHHILDSAKVMFAGQRER